MTTINAYSVALGLNPSGMIDGSKLARSELTSLTRQFSSLATPAERCERAIDLVERALQDQAITERTASEAIHRLRVKYDQLGNSVRTLPGMISQTAGSVTGSIARMAAGYLAFSTASSVLKSSINKSLEVEKAQASFDVLTGSVSKSTRLLGDLKKLAIESPLSFSGTTKAAQTLMSFNVAVQDVMPTLRRLGDVTSGDNERFNSMALAFAQVSAAGRLTGSDLLQMINAGFNPLQEISARTGRSIVALKKDMEDGLISFKMVNDAFISATDEGGKFHGMLDKIGETTSGSMANAEGAIELLQVQLGESLSPLLKQISIDLAEVAGNADSAKAAFDGFGNGAMGFYNFAKSEASLIPAFIRGWSFIGEELGVIADTLATDELFDLGRGMKQDKFVDYLEKHYKERRSEIDAMLRKQKHGDYLDQDNLPTHIELSLREFKKRLDRKEQMQREHDARSKPKPVADPMAAKLEEKKQKALDKLTKKYEQHEHQLQSQLAKLEESKTAAEELKAELNGFTDPQKRRLTYLMSQIEAYEKQKKLVKEREKLEKDAERIRDKYASKFEALVDAMQEIRRLEKTGALSPGEAKSAKQNALNDSIKGMKIETPKGLEVGSQEAYKFIVDQKVEKQNDAIKLALEQKAIAEMQLKEQQEHNRRLAALAEVSPRRAR